MRPAYGIEHPSKNRPQGFSFGADGNLMRSPAPVEDHSQLRSRAESVEIGSRLTLAAAAAALAYAVATWHAPHRTAVLVLLALAAVWALAPLAVGSERVVRTARREALFLGWSVGTVALIGALVAADGGASSPFTLLFFLPLVFAALSYPMLSVVAIGTLDVLTFVAVGLGVGHASQPRLAFFASCLTITAILCAWEALDHGRQRRALSLVSRADPLTGCLNRRGFEERLEAELDSSTRSGGTLGLVVLDLDHFKAVNDSRGHAAGDELLGWTVERAGEALRPMDSLGRIGGDEFAIVVPGAGPAEVREVAERVREALSERVQVSAGVASFPTSGSDRDTLHRAADTDLYAVKHGRAGARDLHFASALASAVNLRMAVPEERATSVPEYALAIAERLDFPDAELAMLRLASTLHDVGKVSVPDRILRKPGPLTIDEFEYVKGHPAAGAEIVAHIDGLSAVADWIRHSHEHFDGTGYPSGLRGEEIPRAARVLLVADAFDSMISIRPYGAPLPPEAALDELRRGAGRQFDPRCVEALAEYLAEHPVELHASARRFSRAAASAA
jgi:diguanylate cyclase (GGDEF)-like protein